MIRFNCDYLEGCHPAILEKLAATNLDQTPGYGMDEHCVNAARMIREKFGVPDADVHFLVGGTQANATVIDSCLRPYEGVLCAETGHINCHETGAIEATGHKVLAMPGREGRISGAQIHAAVTLQGDDEHVVKPGMVYISMSTEVGTIYSRDALRDVYDACRSRELFLYIDGARLGYALESPANDLDPKELAANCDVFTIGGTKVGALFGEAVVINNPKLKKDFRYMIKRHGGMLAKGRLLGIQFEALMEEDRYFSIARKAVAQAMKIRGELLSKGIPMAIDSPTNQIFPIFTADQLAVLSRDFVLENWERVDDSRAVMRICTSWATKDENVELLCRVIRGL